VLSRLSGGGWRGGGRGGGVRGSRRGLIYWIRGVLAFSWPVHVARAPVVRMLNYSGGVIVSSIRRLRL
jgi:hypothetical protein